MNNVNISAIMDFVKEIEKDASAAKKHKRVEGSWVFDEGNPQFVSTIEFPKGKAELKCELPAFAGGWGTSPDPIQYCLFGLAACTAVTFAATATKENVRLKSLKVIAENNMNLRKQMGMSMDDIIKNVKFTVEVEGDGKVPKEKLWEIMRLTEERCPGTECVTRSIPLETELKMK